MYKVVGEVKYGVVFFWVVESNKNGVVSWRRGRFCFYCMFVRNELVDQVEYGFCYKCGDECYDDEYGKYFF